MVVISRGENKRGGGGRRKRKTEVQRETERVKESGRRERMRNEEIRSRVS